MITPEKVSNLLEVVKLCIEEGRFLDTRHTLERQEERSITRPEILHVLKNGYHEKRKDQFDKLHNAWNYVVRGKTVDKKELRVIVSFETQTHLLIITAIALAK